MRSPLGEIPTPREGLSVGADIFRMYRRNEITPRDYMVMNAALVADSAHEERLHLYIFLAPGIRQYVESRYGGSDYDQSWSKKLGDWRYDVFSALDHNRYIVDHFTWAKEKLSEVGMVDKVAKLDESINRFESLKFPSEDYLRVCRIQQMDSGERERRRRE